MDVTQLKTLQDWVVERKLRIVPGVADVLVLGGKTKEYQAEIDLNKMVAHGLSLPQIINAISASNANVGGRTVSIGEQSVNVRAALACSARWRDIGNIVLTQQAACRSFCRTSRKSRSALRRGLAWPGATIRRTSSPASC